jgi:TonB family protein
MRRPVITLLPTPAATNGLGAVIGVLAHALLAVALVAVGGPMADRAVRRSWEEVPEGLRFLVPPPQAPPTVEPALQFIPGAGDGGTSTATVERPDGARRAGARSAPANAGIDGPVPTLDAAAEAAAMNAMLATAYQLLEVDSAAIRDPSSAAPVYPPDLEARGVEGHVIIRFVVDSTGRVDLGSLLTVEATHVAFDHAVREALPLMHFRPAMVGARPVRQLAEQLFRFEIPKAKPNT